MSRVDAEWSAFPGAKDIRFADATTQDKKDLFITLWSDLRRPRWLAGDASAPAIPNKESHTPSIQAYVIADYYLSTHDQDVAGRAASLLAWGIIGSSTDRDEVLSSLTALCHITRYSAWHAGLSQNVHVLAKAVQNDHRVLSLVWWGLQEQTLPENKDREAWSNAVTGLLRIIRENGSKADVQNLHELAKEKRLDKWNDEIRKIVSELANK